MKAKKIQIVVDEDFLKDIDNYAKKMQLSRSAFMNMCCAYTMLMPSGVLNFKGKKGLLKHFEEYAQSIYEVEESDNV